MEIKEIRLSPKRGGHGHITSYSVNLGSAEARLCGLLDSDGQPLPMEKVVDVENGQIIIRAKKAVMPMPPKT